MEVTVAEEEEEEAVKSPSVDSVVAASIVHDAYLSTYYNT